MTVERAGISDIDRLVEARLAYLCEDSGPLSGHDKTAIQTGLPDYFLAHLDRDLFCYVIRGAEAIVSCAFLLVVEKPMSPSFLNGRTGLVLNVYTAPAYRRRGCARAVMTALLNDAAKLQLSRVELKSTGDGVPLYRSIGFVDDGDKYRSMKWTPAARTDSAP